MGASSSSVLTGALPQSGRSAGPTAVAERFAAPLQIVHAIPALGHTPSDAIVNLRAAELDAHDESGEAILRAAERAVRADFKALHITMQVDSPVDKALIELSRSAGLLCSEAMRSRSAQRSWWGRRRRRWPHSTCPVVAWRGDAITPTEQPIVLGVGHDHDNEVAITAGFEFAHRFGQESLPFTHGRHGDQQAMSRFRS